MNPEPPGARTTCPECGRSISGRSGDLVDEDGCPFCRNGGDDA